MFVLSRILSGASFRSWKFLFIHDTLLESKTISSANLEWLSFFLSILILKFVLSKFLKALFRAAINSLRDIESPCRTSLYLFIVFLLNNSVYCFVYVIYQHGVSIGYTRLFWCFYDSPFFNWTERKYFQFINYGII